MRKLLVTGAAGVIGKRLSAHFSTRDYELVLLGRNDEKENNIIGADLSIWNDEWVKYFKGVDTIIHLAGCPRSDAGWDEIVSANIDLTINIYEAAIKNGVKRVIFGSSNWVLAGYRPDENILNSDTVPFPINAYGSSKLFGERLGKVYSDTHGLSTICFRIGFNQHSADNIPGPHMSSGLWGQQMWLSNRDMINGYECAINAPETLKFAVLNLVSNNENMRWDISEAKELIGYVPQDSYSPITNAEFIARENKVREARKTIANIENMLATSRL